MMKPQTRKLRIIGAASLLSLALVAAPARADHGANLVAPIVTAIALGAILHHGHHRHHRHYYYGHGHGHGHYRPHKRHRHSHSYGYGGYEPRKGHKPHKGHKSHRSHKGNRGDKYAGYKRHDKRSHW